MSLLFYKVLHIMGLSLVITALSIRMFAGAGMKKATGIAHGVGMLIVLTGGFGMIARLGLDGFPGWVWVKLLLWVVLGAALALINRKKSPAGIWAGLVIIMTLGAYLALYKPL